MVLEIIGTIIFGAVIGMLARLVLPGKQNIGTLVTIVLGVLGALVGYFIWGAPKDDTSIDWLRWFTSIIAAAIFVTVYSAMREPQARTSDSVMPKGPRPPGRGPFASAVVRRRGRGGPSAGCARR